MTTKVLKMMLIVKLIVITRSHWPQRHYLGLRTSPTGAPGHQQRFLLLELAAHTPIASDQARSATRIPSSFLLLLFYFSSLVYLLKSLSITLLFATLSSLSIPLFLQRILLSFLLQFLHLPSLFLKSPSRFSNFHLLLLPLLILLGPAACLLDHYIIEVKKQMGKSKWM